jgi:hypothetical protein
MKIKVLVVHVLELTWGIPHPRNHLVNRKTGTIVVMMTLNIGIKNK